MLKDINRCEICAKKFIIFGWGVAFGTLFLKILA